MKSIIASQAISWIAITALTVVLLTDRAGPPLANGVTRVDSRIQDLESRIQALQVSHAQASTELSEAIATPEMLERVTTMEHMLSLLRDRVDVMADSGHSIETLAADGSADEQQLFEELVAKAGMVAAGATPETFIPVSPDVSTIGASLVDAFTGSPLSELTLLTASHCEGTTCSFELSFPDTRAAVENELHIMSWLASVDPACGLRFDAFGAEGELSATRQVEIECG